jgi:hypothetical protein
MAERIVRRLRILEYVGPEEWVNSQIEHAGVKGTFIVDRRTSGVSTVIRSSWLGETNELLDTETLGVNAEEA